MPANEHDITATPLELTVDAAVGAMLAWCYPSSIDARAAAMQGCYLCGLDYLEAVAQTMEATGASADTARFEVARSLAATVAKLRASGHEPRRGIVPGGQRTIDDVGNGPPPADFETA
jgi:hypothetical protein